MTVTFYPTVRYHATLAPKGQKFTDEAAFHALGPEWVDTPTKLVPPEPDKPAIADAKPAVATKGRKAAKETA